MRRRCWRSSGPRRPWRRRRRSPLSSTPPTSSPPSSTPWRSACRRRRCGRLGTPTARSRCCCGAGRSPWRTRPLAPRWRPRPRNTRSCWSNGIASMRPWWSWMRRWRTRNSRSTPRSPTCSTGSAPTGGGWRRTETDPRSVRCVRPAAWVSGPRRGADHGHPLVTRAVVPTIVLGSCRPALRDLGCCSRRLVAMLVVSIGLLAGGSTPAAAHALLVESQPNDRAVLAEAPTEVVLTFTEPVTLPSGGLRVLDAEARRVDLGVIATADPTRLAVALPSELPDGGYVVDYRVVSADSHPVGGVRTFTVGDGAEVDAATLTGFADDRAGAVARRVGQGLRGLGYVALLLAGGAVVAGWLVVRRREDRRLAHQLAMWAALAGAATSLLAVPVQAVAVTGDLAALWSGLAWWETATSSFGVAAIARATLLALLATGLLT